MKRKLVLIVVCFSFSGLIQAQNWFPSSGNVGIGTTSPGSPLHIRTDGTVNPWIALDKDPAQEAGFQFRKSGSVLFYFYSDNEENDALKIQSTVLGGENDAYPRVHIPYNNKNIYFGLSGGSVAIGHKSPYSSSSLHLKPTQNSPWSFISEANSNDRIIGLSHDGTNGLVSVSYLGNSGYSPLQLQTSNVPRLTIAVDGKIGVGTTNPLANLHVENGDLLLQNQTSGYPRLWLKDVSGANTLRLDYNSVIGTGDKLFVRSGGAHPLVLNDDGGNVGIGTASPNEKLTVNGTIYGKEVKVDLNVPAPDYVFENDYNLPSLADIENFIDQNKHLPGVPSAADMKASGIELGVMNMLLLKKIEELTLYVIDLKKENQKQDEIIKALQNK